MRKYLRIDVEDEYYLVIYPRLSSRIPISLLSSHPIGTACERIATTTSAERLELLQVRQRFGRKFRIIFIIILYKFF